MLARAYIPRRQLVAVICPLKLREDVHRLLAGIRVENGRVVTDEHGRVAFRDALAVGGHGGEHVWRGGVEMFQWVVQPAVSMADIARAMPAGVTVETWTGES